MNSARRDRILFRAGAWGLILAALAWGGPVGAAERGGDKVKDLEAEGTELQAQVEQLRVNFTERSGLIGVSEARERYEDAVYLFLVGDFETAATSFYILVQSNALGNADLARDSEWYLAECLFEMGNYHTAEEAYRSVVDKGPTHPYFADSVRRAMEVQGLTKDWEAFDSFYNLYIVTGRVPATDLINYSLGKSFYRRGEYGRAKSMFEQLPAGGPYYGRARYFLGVMMVLEKNYTAAIEEFKKVDADPVTDEAHQSVHDQATMALARLYYETGDFSAAQAAYGKITKESPLYADELYESVWTFIKQEKWNEALAQVDIFLLAFPAHRYTASMKILQGHLHMKLQAYDNARMSYEGVVEAYTPLLRKLDDLQANPIALRDFLGEFSGGEAGGAEVIPGYAEELLRSRDEVGRAAAAWATLVEQRKTLAEAEHMVDDLKVAMGGSGDVLGNFVAARNELAGIRGNALSLRNRVLEAEGNWLKSRIPSAYKAELADLQKQRTAAFDSVAEESGTEAAQNDKVQLYDEQIHEIQQRAFRVSQVAQEAQSTARGTLDYLQAGQSKLPASEAQRVRTDVEREQAALDAALTDLEQVQSEVTRRRILRTVETTRKGDDSGQRRVVLQRYEELRRKLADYRRYATDPDAAATFARFDRLWQLADAVERASDETGRVLGVSEARELTAVNQRLAQQIDRVRELRQEIDAAAADTEALALNVLARGIDGVRAQFEDDVLLADKGIVDVYWLRKTGTTDEIAALNADRARLMRELDEQFRIVRENLDK